MHRHYPSLYKTLKFITALKSAWHLLQSLAESNKQHTIYYFKIYLTLPSHLCLGLANALFPSRFHIRFMCYVPLILYNFTVHHRTQNSLKLVIILSHTNSLYSISLNYFKIYSTLTSHLCIGLANALFPLRFPIIIMYYVLLIIQTLTVHYRSQNSPIHVTILSHTNPLHIIPTYYFKIYLTIYSHCA
jgi:hypothetical protein